MRHDTPKGRYFRHKPESYRPCPTPTKAAYCGKGFAKSAATHAQKKHQKQLRVYKCVCGAYHLTSQDINVTISQRNRKA